MNFSPKIFFFCIIIFFGIPSLALSADPGDFNAIRIEDDLSLSFPKEKAEEIVSFLRQKYIDDATFVSSLGPEFGALYGDEDFTDAYFDTPNLSLLKRRVSLRHRLRVNRLDPEDRKNGRELIQLKLSAGDKLADQAEAGSRNEFKFEVVSKRDNVTSDDRHQMIGLIVPEQREDFKNRVRDVLGVNPYHLRPILKLDQRRRRVYITMAGETFVSFSVDDVAAKRWWSRADYSQMELELNELAYTAGDEATRDRMRQIREKMVADLRAAFPYLQNDAEIKYFKTFNLLAEKIPFMKFFIRIGLL